jgi:hypothetical protein
MPSMYMQGLIRMYGGQIGPWTKKLKKWLFVNLWSLVLNFQDFCVYL